MSEVCKEGAIKLVTTLVLIILSISNIECQRNNEQNFNYHRFRRQAFGGLEPDPPPLENERGVISSGENQQQFPSDIFTEEQLKQGAVLLHIIGVVYMIVGLSLVSANFYVPCLDILIQKLKLTYDVGGTVVMAIGISAPAFFTRIIGAFLGDVGNTAVGSIVGSTVFNVMFAIIVACVFSKSILHLSKWPLFRDLAFYILGVVLFVVFFSDNRIFWYESLILLLIYLSYLIFLRFNNKLLAGLHEKLTGARSRVSASRERAEATTLKADPEKNEISQEDGVQVASTITEEVGEVKASESSKNLDLEKMDPPNNKTIGELSTIYEDDQPEQQKFMAWPKGSCKNQIFYILSLPIRLPLYLTLPDVFTPRGRKFFAWGVLGSIAWVMVFTYCLIWWSLRTFATFNIPFLLMGLTVLGIGTAVPFVVATAFIARGGFGDMTISFAMGCNLFYICCQLPISWLVCIIFYQNSIDVIGKGMLCSLITLLVVFFLEIVSVALCRWRISIWLAMLSFIIYLLFIVVAMSFEYKILNCP